MTGPIQEPKRISDMNSAEIAFSLYDDNRDGYVTTREMMKKSKNLTADQVDKVNGNKDVGIIIDNFISRFSKSLILMVTED